MHNMIQKIIDKKTKDLIEEKGFNPPAFVDSINEAFLEKGVGIIAEVKFASPTNPNLGSPKQLLSRVKEYEKAGADIISIITEKHFFKGSLEFIKRVKETVDLPILQKDFVIDEYQIYQAKFLGSNAVLLIVRLLDKKTLRRFIDLAFKIGIEPVIEVSTKKDLEIAFGTSARVLAVNARDLDTFDVSVERASNLLKQIPNSYIKLGFSGVKGREEVEKYLQAGARGVLVGTSLMKTKNIQQFLGGLL